MCFLLFSIFQTARKRIRSGSLLRPIGFLMLTVGISVTASAQTVIPSNAQPVSAVPSAMFDGWFHDGEPTLNGFVDPANSVTFSPENNNSFYQWSWQMLLWLLSEDEEGTRVFDSAAFFGVSPPDSSGNRSFIPHVAGQSRHFSVRPVTGGPDGLPVLMTKQGRLVQIEPPRVSGKGFSMVRSVTGEHVEISRVVLKFGKAIFLDTRGRPILFPRATVRRQIATMKIVQQFSAGKKSVLLDSMGNTFDPEEGQADGSTFMTQNGSLVYYTIITNDVFAYFLTGAKNGDIKPTPTQFPTTQAELDQIVAFAASRGAILTNPETLAVEIKMAWVEASSVPDPSKFITTRGLVPKYNKTSTQWTPTGQSESVELCLVGVHFVGSATNHPEMIWSTFEHLENSPNTDYQYITDNGATQTVSESTSGPWIFCPDSSDGPFNQAHMQFVPSTGVINAKSPFTISPSATIRQKPWGVAADGIPNQENATSAESNTQIISINHSILEQLISGDVRTNYFFVGSTWTLGGAVPTGRYPKGGNEIGTSMLANTTMETYVQGGPGYSSGSNCFSCHTATSPSTFVNISHIYPKLQPLP